MIEVVYVGMDLKDFIKIFPELFISGERSNTVYRNEILFDFAGQWEYNFENNKLKWYVWRHIQKTITESNFKRSLSFCEEIIMQISRYHGRPQIWDKIDLAYRNPKINIHFGYEVLHTMWRTDKMKFNLCFNFEEDNGTFFFLLKIEFRDLTYSFF